MFVTAYALRATGWDPRPPDGLGQYPSPDRQVTAYSDYRTPGEVWIADSGGHRRQVDRAAETQSIGWAPSGRTFFYLIRARARAELRCVSEAGGWNPETVCTLGPLDQDTGRLPSRYLGYDQVYGLDFSPSGRRVAVGWSERTPDNSFVVVIDLDRHLVRHLPVLYRNGTQHWWIDDNHIALAGDHSRVTVTEVWPEGQRSPRSPQVRRIDE